MADTIKCTHCGEKRPALAFAPFPNELGQRIFREICQPCWSGWLQKQTQIINHYGLDLTNPDAQNFLFDNIKGYLFGDTSQLAQIDTSKEGTVEWYGEIGLWFLVLGLWFSGFGGAFVTCSTRIANRENEKAKPKPKDPRPKTIDQRPRHLSCYVTSSPVYLPILR